MAKRKMTEKERVQALIRREKPDRVPIWALAMGFSTVYAKASIADAYNNPAVALAAQRKTTGDFGWVSLPFIGYAAVGGWEFGGDIQWPSGEFAQAPSVMRHPVETVEDVWKLQLPKVDTAGIAPLQIEFCKLLTQQASENKPFRLVVQLQGPFTIAGNIAGVHNLGRWLIKEPKAAHRLLRLSTDYVIELAKHYKKTFGTDNTIVLDWEPTSSNNIISPKQFEQFALPYLKESHEKILALGFRHIFTHICGEHNSNFPYWAKVPMGDPGFISIGKEVELETAAKYFPNDVIMGNLEPAIVQAGTPEEVYQATRKVIEKGKKLKCGFIFAPGCEIPPLASLENVRAMNKAVEDFGWY